MQTNKQAAIYPIPIAYGILAPEVAETPAELVSVTEIEAIDDTSPLIVKGTVNENCDPVGSDPAL